MLSSKVVLKTIGKSQLILLGILENGTLILHSNSTVSMNLDHSHQF